ncbi:hypothetical protein PSD17_55300 [Pseudonocardia sp. D17]|nr:hypothetical protein PSD17_55300 [Pseudonocardia sp. D17]
MPKRGVNDSRLRNWARGVATTPPPRDAVAELLAENDNLWARWQAARTVLDAAEKWAEFNGSTNELLAALDAYRAASGSVEADTPAEPEQHRLDVWERDDSDWTWRCTCQAHGASWPSERAAQEGADEHVREVAGTPAAEPADLLPPREPGDLRPAVERALKMLEGSVLAREVLRLRDVADSLRTDLRRERAAAELAHATVDRLTSTPAAEPAPDRVMTATTRALVRRIGSVRSELADVLDSTCWACHDTGITQEEWFGRDADGAPMVDGLQPCPNGCDIPTWLRLEFTEGPTDWIARALAGAGAPTEPADARPGTCPTCDSSQPHLHPSPDLCTNPWHQPVPTTVAGWRREVSRWAYLLRNLAELADLVADAGPSAGRIADDMTRALAEPADDTQETGHG